MILYFSIAPGQIQLLGGRNQVSEPRFQLIVRWVTMALVRHLSPFAKGGLPICDKRPRTLCAKLLIHFQYVEQFTCDSGFC